MVEPFEPRLIFAESGEVMAARSRDRKLIRFADGRVEHFNLVADPGERQPLLGDCGEPCTLLERKLTDFSAAIAAARSSMSTQVVPFQDQDLEEMRSLGYLD